MEKSRKQKIAAVYVTRFQKERWTDKQQDYPRIDAKFLKDPKYSRASVLHPLPRVGELDAAIDTDSRAIYFEQAAYGVPIRMALISLLLGLQQEQSAGHIRGRVRELQIHHRTSSRSALACVAQTAIASSMRKRKLLT